MIELRVLMSESAFAPPASAARAGITMFVMFGVSFTITGILARLRHPAGDLLTVFGNLAHGRAHAALTHAVRAAVVEFDAVRTGVFNAADDVAPGLRRGFDHGGHDHCAIRPGALDFADLPQIHFERAVGNQLDVVDRQHLLRP